MVVKVVEWYLFVSKIQQYIYRGSCHPDLLSQYISLSTLDIELSRAKIFLTIFFQPTWVTISQR